jgi:hypothetical protein
MCASTPPCCHHTQIKRLKALNATASFTMAGIYPFAADYFKIYTPEYIK